MTAPCRLAPPLQTNDTFNRATAHPNFELHTGSAWQALEPTGDGKQVCAVWRCTVRRCTVLRCGALPLELCRQGLSAAV